MPTNVLFFVLNTKATTPDAISSITDAHADIPVKDIDSVSTIATSTIRGSIWGGIVNGRSVESSNFTVTYGGTQTGFMFAPVTFNGSSLSLGTPSTSTNILQATTNSGTTDTAQGVTQTPTAGEVGFQILLVATEGSASSYTAGAGGFELADANNTAPNMTAGLFIFDPPVTNPSATIAAGGSNYVALCLEIARGGYPITASTSGIIIE